MFKKLSALFSLVIMLFALSACGLIGTTIDFANLSKKTVITVWMDNEGWATELITAFEKKYPDIKVKFNNVGAVDTRQKMETAGPAGLGADVFVMPHDHIGAALEKGLLFPIGGNYKKTIDERLIESAVGTASVCFNIVEGKQEACKENNSNKYTFAVPISGESLALFYNKDLVKQLTGKEDPATTFEEIFSQAKQYNNYNNMTDGKLDPKLWFAADVGNAYDMHWLATAHGFELFGPNRQNPDMPNFNSNAMKAALAMQRTIRTEYLDLESATLNGDWIKSRFEQGKLAYTIDGPWSIARYKKAGINFGVIKLPTLRVDGKDVQPITFSGVQVAAIYRGAPIARQEAALKFVDFMISDEGMTIMYKVTGKLPALKDVSKIEYTVKKSDGSEEVVKLKDDPYLSGITAQLNYSEPMPIIPEMGYFWSVAGSMYSDTWNNVVKDDKGNKVDSSKMTVQEIAQRIAEATQKGYNDLRKISE